MKYLLDANILIDLVKNKPPSIASRIDALDDDAKLGMSFFTFAALFRMDQQGLTPRDLEPRIGSRGRM